jgi:mxaK protein
MALDVAYKLDLRQKLARFFSVKKLTWAFALIAFICLAGSIITYKRMQQINAFNGAILAGKTPETDKDSFEAKFATALYLAKKERFKEATLLFTALMPKANAAQKSAVQYNVGNIFLLRANAMGGRGAAVSQETEYLLQQSKTAYVASLKLDNTQWDAKHNLDRLLGLLPETPTPGVGEGDKAGLIMGNVPVGLP